LVSPMEQKAKHPLVSPFLRGTEGGSKGDLKRGREGESTVRWEGNPERTNNIRIKFCASVRRETSIGSVPCAAK